MPDLTDEQLAARKANLAGVFKKLPKPEEQPSQAATTPVPEGAVSPWQHLNDLKKKNDAANNP